MDIDALAERDRARRLKQMKNAKMQALALIICVIAGLIYGVIAYLQKPRGKAPEPIDKATPIARPDSTPAASPQKTAGTASPAAEATQPAPSPASSTSVPAPAAGMNETPPVKPVAEPEKSGRIGGPGLDTLQQTPDAMKRLLGGEKKGAVPVANVLASIGVTDSEKSKRELPKVTDARRVLDLLAKAKDVGSKLEYVIAKPGIEERMKAYYETEKLLEPEAGEQAGDFQVEVGGEKYLDVQYKSSVRPAGTLHACFVRNEKGIVCVDWESLVGYNAMPMKAFRESRPVQPVTMRVLASLDDYHNYEFIDSKKFVSIRLRNADGSDAVNGFCESGGRVANAITANLAETANKAPPPPEGADAAAKRVWSPVIVKLRFPAKAQSDHCVELVDVIRDRWLAPMGVVE